MKKILFLLFMICCFSQTNFAQSNSSVSNVDWNLNESEDQITITYDLTKDGNKRYFDVYIKVNIEGNEFIPKALSGDVGNYIKAGKNKEIIWDVFNDVTELSGDLEILVIGKSIGTTTTTQEPNAIPKVERKKRKVPIFAGLGGVALLGGGFIYSGAKKMSDSKKLYNDVYAVNQDPNAAIYSDTYNQTRSEFYKEVNKDYRNGSLSVIGGSTIVIIGGVILIKRIIDLNRINSNGFSVNPYYDISPTPYSTPRKNIVGEVGFAMKYNF